MAQTSLSTSSRSHLLPVATGETENKKSVIPAQAGIHIDELDTGLHRYDEQDRKDGKAWKDEEGRDDELARRRQRILEIRVPQE